MSITITQSPESITPVFNSMQYRLSSTQTSQPNFRYVAEVSGTALLARLKCDKLPTTNAGFFDVKKVVETLIVPAVPTANAGFATAQDIAADYFIGFKEEYGTPPAIVTGVTSASGTAFYGALTQIGFRTYDKDDYFVNGTPAQCLTDNDRFRMTPNGLGWLYVGQQTNNEIEFARVKYYNQFGVQQRSYVVSEGVNQRFLRFGSGASQIKALTSGQASDGNAGSHLFPALGYYTLQFIKKAAFTQLFTNNQDINLQSGGSHWTYASTPGGGFTWADDVGLKFTATNASQNGTAQITKSVSTIIGQQYVFRADMLESSLLGSLDNIVFSIGASGSLTSYALADISTIIESTFVATGTTTTLAITMSATGAALDIGSSIEFGNAVFASTTDANVTNLIRYDIECERFETRTVHFRNKLGGVDSYPFTMKNRKFGNVEKQTFGKNSDVYGTEVFDAIYSGEYEESYQLNSDWLTDAESEWLFQLVNSPQVWLEINGALIEAIVQNTSYQFMTRRNDKLQQLQITLRVAYKNTIV